MTLEDEANNFLNEFRELLQKESQQKLYSEAVQLMEKKKFQKAITLLDTILAQGNNPVAAAMRGEANFSLGKYPESIRDYTLATRNDPQNHLYLYGLARAKAKKEQWQEAIAHLNAISQPDKDELTLRGACYMRSGDYQRALHDLTEAIDKDLFNGRAYLERAHTYLSLGDLSSAEADIFFAKGWLKDKDALFRLETRLQLAKQSEETRRAYERLKEKFGK